MRGKNDASTDQQLCVAQVSVDVMAAPPPPLRLQASSETGNAPKLVFGRPFLSSTQSYPPEDLSEARLGRGDSAVNKYKETVAP